MKKVLVVFCVFLTACTQELYQPVGLGLTSAFSDASVMTAIEQGAEQAGWRIVSSAGRKAVARFEDGDGFAEVLIECNREVIEFVYQDSEGLGYDASGQHPRINVTYNDNVQELEEEIAMHLAEVLSSK